MLGALIGCGLAAVGGAAIGSYIGTARGVETGLRVARRCGGYGGGGAFYDNREAYERDRKLLLQKLAKRDAENSEFKDFMLRLDAKIDRVAQFEELLFYISLMTEAEKVAWREGVLLEMQKERLEKQKEQLDEYNKLELKKQPEYERMVEEARKKALADKDSYYGREHQLELLAIDYRWWRDCMYYVMTSHSDAVDEVALVLHGILSKAVSMLGDERHVVYFFRTKGCHDVDFIMHGVHTKYGSFTGDSRRMRGADLGRYE
jgi:hypothetical protein